MNLFGDDDIVYDDDYEEGHSFFDDEEHEHKPASQSLTDPKAMSFCLGHEEQENLFLELINKQSLPHAMIFAGNEGIGKTTMAFRLARFLLKTGIVDNNQDSLFGGESIPKDKYTSLDVSVDDPVFSRIRSGGHADLLHIFRHYDASKDKTDSSLKVDALRKIEPFLRRTSSEGGWRIVIIEDADTMNRNAQNAVLKILEEPPPNVLIILVAHRPGMLIPTIRSRARMINFSSLSPDIMRNLLSMQNISLSADDMQIISSLSEGSIGKAMNYAQDGGLEMLNDILVNLEGYPNIKMTQIHNLSNSLSSSSQDKKYRLFAELMPWIFKQILLEKVRGKSVPLSGLQKNSGLVTLSSHHTLNSLIEVVDNLQEHFSRVDFSNLDKRDAVRDAFLMISQ